MSQDKEMQTQNGNISLSAQDLKELISTAVASAVAAAKAPTEIEQRKIDAENREIQQKQEMRKKTADEVKQGIENKKVTQRLCSHEHSNGTTHCVYIQEKVGPGYILCQKNQCVIRPGVASPNYKGTVIYDNDLFNKLFQKTNQANGDIQD